MELQVFVYQLYFSNFYKSIQEYLEKTKQELRLRKYSFKTTKAYLCCLKDYFDFKKFDLEKI